MPWPRKELTFVWRVNGYGNGKTGLIGMCTTSLRRYGGNQETNLTRPSRFDRSWMAQYSYKGSTGTEELG